MEKPHVDLIALEVLKEIMRLEPLSQMEVQVAKAYQYAWCMAQESDRVLTTEVSYQALSVCESCGGEIKYISFATLDNPEAHQIVCLKCGRNYDKT